MKSLLYHEDLMPSIAVACSVTSCFTMDHFRRIGDRFVLNVGYVPAVFVGDVVRDDLSPAVGEINIVRTLREKKVLTVVKYI